ncbi:hypothetical protein [Nonomuraea sp. LPB2021202275-12-8]|uniref:hypothetical protein n=1 Tax=Nonomuraea sp. LPB2021202275-12-8 TaxID=3120159 RepID=UPI00300D8231
MTTTAMIVFGHDLGGPAEPLGWKFPTRHAEPAVDWFNPSDPDELSFGEQAAAHLLALKGEHPNRDGQDSDLAEDLWGVHMVWYGSKGREGWLLGSHRTIAPDRAVAEPLDMRQLLEEEGEYAELLRAALDALGIPEPAAPSWLLSARDT